MTLSVQSPFVPRGYQKEFFAAMSDKKRAFLLYHRRAGKDIACWNYLIYRATQKVATYYYVLPTYTQGKRVIWDGITESGMRIINYIPSQCIEGKPNASEMKIKLVNGSVIQVIGSENYDSIRGTNPQGVVLSEFAMQQPRIWSEVLSPILLKNGGWAVFNTTPMGKNFAYDLWTMARANETWFTQFLTIADTGLITEEQIDSERAEGKPEDVIQQEYYCSFDRGVEGSYYGQIVAKMRLEERIGRVAYEPRSAVNTYWDIGYGDATAIVFAQTVGSEFRIIDYYENQGESLAHYIHHLQGKPYVYGSHYFPHDAGSGSIHTGKTLQNVALELGFKAHVLPRDDFEVGIEATRALLNVCYIDEVRCRSLIKCLENYHKKYNEKFNCYSDTPVHDAWSHGADAFRYTAMARQHYGTGTSTLSAEKIKDMRERNLGY